MGNLVILALAVMSLLGAVSSKLLADEFKAWAPSLVSSIIAMAVRVLPPSQPQHDRSEEEWVSHVNDVPGDLSKIVFACGCVLAACKINGWPLRIGKRTLDIVLSSIAIMFFMPVIVIVAVLITIDSPGPILIRRRRVNLRGVTFVCYQFRTFIIEKNGIARPTKLGQLFKRASLDELPLLLNVLKGNVSILDEAKAIYRFLRKLLFKK